MTRLEKLESILADGNWHSTEELVQSVGHRFSATIHVAIHQYRYRIEKRRSHGSQFEYRKLLRNEPRLQGNLDSTSN
jgi:hypothetical protein